MRLIIDIDEELYEAYKGRPPMLGDAGMDMIAQAIANGTPLPKGHGRLIDADDIDNHIVGSVNTRDCPTIIDADMRGEEE